MEAFNLIPQVFFDFIARLIPGAVALFLLDLWSKENLWERLLRGVSVDLLNGDNVTAIAFLTLSGTAYIIGQLLAPVGKLWGKAAQALWFKVWRKSSALQGSKEETWLCYDWLRVHFPEAGALTAKVRAEYTMFNSLSARFLHWHL